MIIKTALKLLLPISRLQWYYFLLTLFYFIVVNIEQNS